MWLLGSVCLGPNAIVHDGVGNLSAAEAGGEAPRSNVSPTSGVLQAQSGLAVFPQAGHSNIIPAAAFSPDGKWIVSGSWDDTLKLWDATSGREVRTFSGHTADVVCVAFSPNGQRVLSGSKDCTPRLWDVSTGRATRALEGHTKGVRSVAVSPDGRSALSGGGDKTVRLWDLSSGASVKTLRGHSSVVCSVAFSPDGRCAVSGSGDGTARVWNLANGSVIHTLSSHKGAVQSATFTPDGEQILTADYYGRMRLWHATTGRLARTFGRLHPLGVGSLALSPDGRRVIITGTLSRAILLYDVSSGNLVRSWDEQGSYVSSVAFAPDGRRALAATFGKSYSLRLWDINTARVIRTFGVWGSDISSMATSPDGGHILVGSYDGTAKLWDISRGRRALTLGERSRREPSRRVVSVAVSPDGTRALTGGADRTMKLWNLLSGQSEHTFAGHTNSVTFAAFNRGGSIALAGTDNMSNMSLSFWEVASGKRIRTLERVPWGSMSSDGHRMLGPFGTGMKLCDTRLGTSIRFFPGYPHGVMALALSADAKLALSAGYDGVLKQCVLKLWDVPSGSEIRTLTGHRGSVRSVVFSSDSKKALSGSQDMTVVLWDISSGQKLDTMVGHMAEVNHVAFMPGRQRAASADRGGTIHLWNLGNGDELCRFIGFRDGEWIALTPEGFFNASPSGAKHLNVRLGNEVYAMDQFYDALYRPDLVREKLKGDPEGLVAAAAERLGLSRLLAGGAPPRVAIVSPEPGASDRRDVEVSAEIRDEGGGIGRTVWTLNGVTVGAQQRDDRGLGGTVGEPGPSTWKLSKLLTLSPGKNVIQVAAFNQRNEILSDPATIELGLSDSISTPPSLYVLTVAVDKYRDRALWLRYCKSDAKALASAIKANAASVFRNTVITEMFDEKATLAGVGAAFRKLSGETQSHDVFVMYLAGHGVTHDGRYYYLPYDFRFRSRESVLEQGITQDHLMGWLSTIKAQKSVVLLDTCNSGSFTKTQVAMRSIAEKTAIDRLVRATGRATIVAAKDKQPALEGYKGHGIFTYVLLQAFAEADQKHGNRDKVTSVREIAAYVDDQVPKITFKAFGYEQIPQVNMHGRDFPLSVVP